MAPIPTVLVMDDDAGVRSTMERLLKVYGYGAVTAATLDEARTLLGSTPIEALILDVGLQAGDSGLDLLDAVRAHPVFKRALILIFTGGFLTDAENAMIVRHG